MRLLLWLSPVALLSTGVTAFYPYTIKSPTKGSSNPTIKERYNAEKPTPSVDAEGAPKNGNGVKVDIVKVPKVRRENAFTILPGTPTTMPHSVPVNTDGSDYSYFSVVEVGSERQKMYMLVDTGAASTWLMGTNCTEKACKMHNTFGSEDSKTIKITDIPWDVTYGAGEVEGVMVNDSMSFAGMDLTLSFGSALWTSQEFEHYPMDGILGLGRSSQSIADVPTFMQAVQLADLIEKNIIGINLQRTSDSATDGQLVFGDVDKTKFTGDIAYTSTLPESDNRWQIPVEDIFVDGKAVGFEGKSALLDTGTSFVLMPLEDAKRVHDLIPDSTYLGNDEFSVPCSAATTIEVALSGVKYSISPKDYVGDEGVVDGTCISRIAGPKPLGDDEWILGDVFLKNVYAVFDFDENRIGFASSKSSDSPSPTSKISPSGSGSPISPISKPGNSGDAAAPAQTTNANGGGQGNGSGALSVPFWLSTTLFLATTYFFGVVSLS
ncbi:hypothetical protein FQN50_000801 [Emmonsiellopsis sp. PD_5]|nr:hypothetical protein FQN50_000801 [Emmonsiellopsis sp. PD_5]